MVFLHRLESVCASYPNIRLMPNSYPYIAVALNSGIITVSAEADSIRAEDGCTCRCGRYWRAISVIVRNVGMLQFKYESRIQIAGNGSFFLIEKYSAIPSPSHNGILRLLSNRVECSPS